MQSTEPDLVLYERLFSAATRRAAEAIKIWAKGSISMAVDDVKNVPIESACEALGIGDDMLSMIVLTLEGELGGQFMLSFDIENGRKMAEVVLGKSSGADGEFTELEKSVLMETGNIVGCAYLNELTETTGAALVPSPPHYVVDFGAVLVEQAVMGQAMLSDRILIGSTEFRHDDQRLEWQMLFVPTSELLAKLGAAMSSC